MAARSKPDAVLFDFDGTLINSDEAHLSAFNEVLLPFQLQMTPADYATCAGRSNCAIFRELLKGLSADAIAALDSAKEAIYLRRLDRILEQPGVTPVLRRLSAARMKLAVVTNAPRSVVRRILGRLRLESFFKVLVCIDDVANGKPDPEPHPHRSAATGCRPVTGDRRRGHLDRTSFGRGRRVARGHVRESDGRDRSAPIPRHRSHVRIAERPDLIVARAKRKIDHVPAAGPTAASDPLRKLPVRKKLSSQANAGEA